jgi:hypothetical protein
MKASSIIAILLLTFIFSCKKEKDLDVAPTSIINDFYPLKSGRYAIYNVQKSTYDANGRHDSTYQLKELFSEPWTDLENGVSYKYYRYKKKEGQTSFVFDSVWHVKFKTNALIAIENNVPFIKLRYPIVEGNQWNGNELNTYPTQYYTALHAFQNWQSYPQSVRILQRNDSIKFIKRNLLVDVYAQNIGLVHKEIRNVNYSTSAADFGQGVIKDGYTLKQELVEYGVE